MCDFANSRDDFRYSPDDLEALLSGSYERGFRYVRFTGGEPLMHAEIDRLLNVAKQAGMKTSIITNGKLLPRKINDLVSAGLDQVIVSIDSSRPPVHDMLRDTRGSFKYAVEGLRLAREKGLHCRVNTVVGPHNYKDMPALQRLLIELEIDQWELSALKLPTMPTYADPEDAVRVGTMIFSSERLRPTGIMWFGETQSEQEQFFGAGIPPRPRSETCFAARDIAYLDAKAGLLYPCSCLPHRPDQVDTSGPEARTRTDLMNPVYRANREYFMREGPKVCDNCSTTATGYSDLVLNNSLHDWAY